MLCSGFEPVGTFRFSDWRSVETGGIVVEGRKNFCVSCDGPGKGLGSRALDGEVEVEVVAKMRKSRERMMWKRIMVLKKFGMKNVGLSED